ncbi:hypothetical protein [Halomonas binhaiensis]|uniref:Uncharacterized protein n=1 Tax=Halomonas binhaiensis TaxID=2562282 RepID=A0A5C1NI86_9GAMM|nr:hypothetical protein [Halomonas binhaiensis]QEM82138.1 hypothetical protein E4T21_11700 [Halomonas binhaiensis]
MDFNPHVLLLFGNAFLVTVLSVATVGVILVREYRPTIRRLQQAEQDKQEMGATPAPSETHT